jgi:hypothetical protein
MGKSKGAAAVSTAPADDGPKIDADKSYRVTLARVVRMGRNGRTVLHPKNDNVLSGKALLAWSTEDRDAIAKIEEA